MLTEVFEQSIIRYMLMSPYSVDIIFNVYHVLKIIVYAYVNFFFFTKCIFTVINLGISIAFHIHFQIGVKFAVI